MTGPSDPFADVQRATRRHRGEHGCGAYTYSDGSLPGVIAAAAGARRIVEVGTALGYTAMWMAHACPHAHVETIELDADHVRLARENISHGGLAGRVTVHHGEAQQVLATLDRGSYDLGFFDGFAPTATLLQSLSDRLRPGGVLIAGNLTLTRDRAVQDALEDPRQWLTHGFGETAIAVKR